MKVNFDTELNALNGKPIQYADDGKVRGMQLRDAAVDALINQSNSLPDGEQKFRVFELCERIHKGGEVEITPEEASEIKAKIGQAWGANIVGPAYRLLNG